MTSTFLLGLGCQKGGTTWLYDYLSGSPQFAHGFRKEYHVLDALDLPSEHAVRRRLLAQAAEAVGAEPGDLRAARAALRLAMYLDTDVYVDYFTALLHRTPDTRLVADLTPAYGMLPAARLRQVRDDFARRGVRVLPVFLMRDPVDRAWSQVRMHARLYDDHAAASQDPVEYLLEHHASPAYARRTRYDLTLRTTDEVFAPDEVFHGFYEDLFTDATTRRLCAQAGIDHVAPDVDKRVHASPTDQVLPEETVRVVAEHHREVYLAVARRFPDVDLRTLWPSSRFVL